MKNIFTSILFLTSLFMLGTSYAQNEVMNQACSAVKTADVEALAQHFDVNIDLKTDQEEGNYSKNQAKMLLKNFFKRNPSVSFVYNHQGSSLGGGAKYAIGTYKTSNATYRVYMKLKQVKNEYVIDTLDFTKE